MAVRALGFLSVPSAIPILVKALDDSSLVEDAAYGLGMYGPLAREALPTLLRELRRAKRENRTEWYVGKISGAIQFIDPEGSLPKTVRRRWWF